MAALVAIQKPFHKEKANGYKPVGLKLAVFKCSKQIIVNQLCLHHANNKVVNSVQHSSDVNRSCPKNLQKFPSKKRPMDEGRSVEVHYADLSKAFGLVSNLLPLTAFDMARSHGLWMRQCLTSGTFASQVGQIIITIIDATRGVPPALTSLLFTKLVGKEASRPTLHLRG